MNVLILGFDQSYASAIVGMLDIFNHASRILLEESQNGDLNGISVKMASPAGEPIVCQNKILLNAHCAFEDIRQTDAFIIPPVHHVENDLSEYRYLIDLLKKQYQSGAALASICTGAFLLAETGLLDGRNATTHWSMADMFRKRYAAVHLRPEKLVINPNNTYCSGGSGAGVIMAFYLLEKYLGPVLAARTAKFFAHDIKAIRRQVREGFRAKTDHGDRQIVNAQHWIEQNLNEPIDIQDLSKAAAMSRRTFERRFKNATGDTPLAYIQRLKVEAAKRQLETTNLSFDEIAYQLGYMDSGAFRKIFVRLENRLPSEYRRQFTSET